MLMIEKENAQITRATSTRSWLKARSSLVPSQNTLAIILRMRPASATAPACARRARLSSVSTGMNAANTTRFDAEILEAEPLGEGADADLQEIGHRKDVPDDARRRTREDTGVSMPENCVAGTTVRIAVPNRAAIWVRVNEDISMP